MKTFHLPFPAQLIYAARLAYAEMAADNARTGPDAYEHVTAQLQCPLDAEYEARLHLRATGRDLHSYRPEICTGVGLQRLQPETGHLEFLCLMEYSVDPRRTIFEALFDAFVFEADDVTVRPAPDHARLSVDPAALSAPRRRIMAKHRHYAFADVKIRRLRGGKGETDRYTVELALIDGPTLSSDPMPAEALGGTHRFEIAYGRPFDVAVELTAAHQASDAAAGA